MYAAEILREMAMMIWEHHMLRGYIDLAFLDSLAL